MKLLINELALIRDSVFEDAQFTLIAGDNGTGKTIFLESLVIAKKTIDKKINKIIGDIQNELHNISFEVDEGFWEDIYSDIRKYKKSSQQDENRVIFNKNYLVKIDFKQIDSIKEIIENNLNNINEEITKDIMENVFKLNDFFESMDLDLKERYFNNNKFSNYIDIELTDIPMLDNCVYTCDFSYHLKETYLIIFIKINDYERRFIVDLVKEIGYGFNQEIIDDGKDLNWSKVLFSNEEIRKEIENSIKSRVLEYFYKDYLFKGVHFFPSERISNMDTALRSLLDGKLNNGNLRYSEMLFNKNYLEYKDLISRFKLPPHRYDNTLKNLVGGDYIVDSNGEIIGLEQKNGTIIPRKLFSTKQIRMIPYQMLEIPIRAYDLVIIEEPEAHLSLESLKALIPFFKHIMDSGNQLIISTHSEILVQLLNNSILLDEKINSKVYEMKIDGDTTKLVEVEKGMYGYSIELMNRNLEELFIESNKLHQEIEGDSND